MHKKGDKVRFNPAFYRNWQSQMLKDKLSKMKGVVKRVDPEDETIYVDWNDPESIIGPYKRSDLIRG